MTSTSLVSSFRITRATLAFFASSEGFADVCAAHHEQGRIRAADQERLRSHGLLPHPNTPAGERHHAIEARQLLLTALWRSLIASLVATVGALIAAAFLGKVSLGLPVDAGKLLQVLGGSLALWGTLYAVQGPARSLGGTSAPELVHAFVFTCILSSGGAFAILGTLL